MKEWYFCVAVAGLLLSSCSQQVQERADGGKTSDTIITEVPVEETCDSTGYRLYQKYLAAIGENPSYFQWKDFPKYLGAAYVDEKGHFVIHGAILYERRFYSLSRGIYELRRNQRI